MASGRLASRPGIGIRVASPTLTYVCGLYRQFHRQIHVLGAPLDALHVARTLFSLAPDAAGMGTFLSRSHSDPHTINHHNWATATMTRRPSSPAARLLPRSSSHLPFCLLHL